MTSCLVRNWIFGLLAVISLMFSTRVALGDGGHGHGRHGYGYGGFGRGYYGGYGGYCGGNSYYQFSPYGFGYGFPNRSLNLSIGSFAPFGYGYSYGSFCGYSGYRGLGGYGRYFNYSGYGGLGGYCGYRGYGGLGGYGSYCGYGGYGGPGRYGSICGYSGYGGYRTYAGYCGLGVGGTQYVSFDNMNYYSPIVQRTLISSPVLVQGSPYTYASAFNAPAPVVRAAALQSLPASIVTTRVTAIPETRSAKLTALPASIIKTNIGTGLVAQAVALQASPNSIIKTNEAATPFQIEAEQAFSVKDYQRAVRLNGHALIEDRDNAHLHLFASQCLFALEDYRSAAMAVAQAMSLSEAKDWGYVVENFRSFYRDDAYVKQMAQLVQFNKDNPDAGYGFALRGYHYLFLGHRDAAKLQLSKALKIQPKDPIAQKLLDLIDNNPSAEQPATIPNGQGKQP